MTSNNEVPRSIGDIEHDLLKVNKELRKAKLSLDPLVELDLGEADTTSVISPEDRAMQMAEEREE